MAGVEAAWWLLFFGVFGLCTGSFLNVVIYRLPRDISLRDPRWSFCPGCLGRIRWYDNLPLLSYVLLSARCRHCGMRIAPRYPLVETLGALVALLLFDAFFIAHTHGGIGQYFRDATSPTFITWQASEDWPIYIAHFVLFAALLAMSAIDIEHYWVDVRFTWFATAAGFVLHAIWSPRSPDTWHRPSAGLGCAALAMCLILLATMLVLRRKVAPPDAPPGEPADLEAPDFAPIFAGAPGLAEDPDNAAAPPDDQPAATLPVRPALWLAGLVLAVVLVGAWAQAADVGDGLPPSVRWLPAIGLFMLLIVAGGLPRRAADHAIMEAIEAERQSARRMAAGELLMLLPAVVAGGLIWYLAPGAAEPSAWPTGLLAWSPVPGWHPLRGLATAAAGFIIGGGIGWLVRITATLIMGREAFGVGDIHMMAAAGCVAGWPVVLLGFVICSLLALAGWLMLVPFKRSRAIPLGPWLSIAFLIVVLFYDPILAWTPVRNVVSVFGDPVSTFHNIMHP